MLINTIIYSFAFGRFIFQIELDSELLRYIPKSFSVYSIPDVSNCVATLRVRGFVVDPICKPNNGWTHFQNDNVQVVTYSNNDEVLFSLVYSSISKTYDVQVSKNNPRALSLAIQHAMLIALSAHCIGLHGATLICKDKLIILSAPSGTGKTTLANLLQKHCEAAVINGDFALLSVMEDHVIFEPTPFCGTSQRCLNYRLRPDQIVFLSQSPDNTFRFINSHEALVNLLSNIFIPIWDEALVKAVEKNAFNMIELLPISAFSFAPNKEAAEMLNRMVNM